ncbi:hypothetical protein F4692_004059 [Nocardioides cavernae]|uniref:Peptidase MA-like domain-containing protein n=1 Tax=Nocardioides cavernae TaxID=1921566 RepID=A0A7Y9H7T5_9ACTN|nr:hypothetical protein [Nocardioides cavernae]NYE38904.1 hypothetical protein [Nocardioides cavernae]
MAVLAVVLTRDDRREVEPRQVDVPRASPAAASTALADFVAGVRAGDEGLPGDAGSNARALGLSSVTARYVDQVGTVGEDGSWSGVVEVSWQVDGFDAQPARAEVAVSFAPEGDGVAITGFGGEGAGRVPLWLGGALAVARADGVLAMVHGDQREARAVVERARRGIGVVRQVLRDWTGPVVVEVPASAADLDAALGVEPGTYAGVAAVTAAVGGSAGRGAPVHVFVNPDVTEGLRRAGAQVVMSHELAHVATDAVRTPIEPWLLEGFADWVALRDTRLPDRTTLGRAIAAARRDGVPGALPTAADLDPRGADLQARYEEAWLACRIIAERLGEQGLVEVYERVARGGRVGRELARAGLPVAGLTRAWRQRLADLAG